MKKILLIISLICFSLFTCLFICCGGDDGSNETNGTTNGDQTQTGGEDGSGDEQPPAEEPPAEQPPAKEPLAEVMFQGFRFNLKKDKTYELTYSGASSNEVVVPAEVDGVAVTSIGDSSFSSSAIKSITLPESVKTIGYQAFAYNSVLKDINLDKVEVIDERAFMNCSALKNINLSSVTKIEKNAFANCSLLSSLNMPNVLWLKENAFSMCVSLQTVEIGNKCIQIFADAFRGCSTLTSVTLGSSDGYWYYYLVRTDQTGDQIRGENNTGSVAGFGEKLENPTTCAQFLTQNHNAGVFFAQYEYFETYCKLTFDPTVQQHQLPRKNMYS